jgi:hypothetical protein
MQRLLEGSTPLMLAIRPEKVLGLVYGFGNASGECFGSWLNFIFTDASARILVHNSVGTIFKLSGV